MKNSLCRNAGSEKIGFALIKFSTFDAFLQGSSDFTFYFEVGVPCIEKTFKIEKSYCVRTKCFHILADITKVYVTDIKKPFFFLPGLGTVILSL